MSYLKGKDIKVQGDCLVYCFTKKIETLIRSYTTGFMYQYYGGNNIEKVRNDKLYVGVKGHEIYTDYTYDKKPEDFHKW